jgi:hypothetical protein
MAQLLSNDGTAIIVFHTIIALAIIQKLSVLILQKISAFEFSKTCFAVKVK